MASAPENLARTVLTDPVHFLAFGFGTGLSPFAPGTVGSLVGVIFAWLTLDLGLPLQLGIAAAISLSGRAWPALWATISGSFHLRILPR